RILVIAPDSLIKLARHPADRGFATGVGHPEAARGKSANKRTRLDQDYGTATSSRLHGRDDPSRRAAINNDVVYRRVFDVRFGVQVLCDDGGGCQGKRQ